jgi:calcium-binding protein CML
MIMNLLPLGGEGKTVHLNAVDHNVDQLRAFNRHNSQVADQCSSGIESQSFDFNLEDAWHYGFVLNSHPSKTKLSAGVITRQQEEAPPSSLIFSFQEGRPAESDAIFHAESDSRSLLSEHLAADTTSDSSQSINGSFSKLESCISAAGSSIAAAGASCSNNARHKREMERLFATYDEDNDGHISRRELGSVMQKLGMETTDEELNCMLRSLDKNGDGLVDFEEFVDFQVSLSVAPGNVASTLAGAGNSEANGGIQMIGSTSDDDDDDLREAFGVFDKDKNGFICVKELYSVLRSLGISANTTITSCQKMISAVDRNGDGLVDFIEFKDLMTAESFS